MLSSQKNTFCFAIRLKRTQHCKKTYNLIKLKKKLYFNVCKGQGAIISLTYFQSFRKKPVCMFVLCFIHAHKHAVRKR